MIDASNQKEQVLVKLAKMGDVELGDQQREGEDEKEHSGHVEEIGKDDDEVQQKDWHINGPEVSVLVIWTCYWFVVGCYEYYVGAYCSNEKKRERGLKRRERKRVKEKEREM